MDQEELQKNTVADGYSSLPADAEQFVTVPETEGLLDYGMVGPELAVVAGMAPVPIRLLNGKHFGAGGGYGVAHMLYHHAAGIALFNYHSIQDFVDEIAHDFDAVYAARDQRYLVVKRKGGEFSVDRLLVLELANPETITAW